MALTEVCRGKGTRLMSCAALMMQSAHDGCLRCVPSATVRAGMLLASKMAAAAQQRSQLCQASRQGDPASAESSSSNTSPGRPR